MASPVGAAAAWGVRKALTAAYRKRTGSPPPRMGQRDASLKHVMVWSVVSAAALALVEVLVARIFRADDETPAPTPPDQDPSANI